MQQNFMFWAVRRTWSGREQPYLFLNLFDFLLFYYLLFLPFILVLITNSQSQRPLGLMARTLESCVWTPLETWVCVVLFCAGTDPTTPPPPLPRSRTKCVKKGSKIWQKFLSKGEGSRWATAPVWRQFTTNKTNDWICKSRGVPPELLNWQQ
jgi:hypothetical protein